MRDFPASQLVYVHRYTTTGRNSHNVPIKTFVPQLDSEGEAVMVIQWFSVLTEPKSDQPVERVELYVPPTLRDPDGNEVDDIKPEDMVNLPHGRYSVSGIRDYTTGFHGWRALKVVDLERPV